MKTSKKTTQACSPGATTPERDAHAVTALGDVE
jgi:hypothetical protein